MRICILDPGLSDNEGTLSANLGDLIIQESVRREIRALFGEAEIVSISTHAPMGDEQIRLYRSCDLAFVGGTNLLSSNMDEYRQWDVTLRHAFHIRKAVLLGVGWWQYQGAPNLFTRLLMNLALSRSALHSVRDSYTVEKMKQLGFRSVVNTGCPTMWPLAEIPCNEFQQFRQPNVLVMLTDYYKRVEYDKKLLDVLFANYQTVYFWPQGMRDREYVDGLGYPVVSLDHSLSALVDFLGSGTDFDYIGTRLHGGIRCLLDRRRCLILAVDNRAREIANDTNLNVLGRDDLAGIDEWIRRPTRTELRIRSSDIAEWRKQFDPRRSRVRWWRGRPLQSVSPPSS